MDHTRSDSVDKTLQIDPETFQQLESETEELIRVVESMKRSMKKTKQQ